MSTLTVSGFSPSTSTVMSNAEILRRGTFDVMWSRAAFSAKMQMVSFCSGESSGSPISSNVFT